jgi:uncharacterized protein
MPEQIFRLIQKMRWLFLILPFFYAIEVSAQEPQNAPETQYWVTDQADVLDLGVIQTLTKNAEQFEEDTTHQVVVVTVDSLVGWSIERYGRWLGNRWGIGQAGKNNGVLLLVAPEDRKVRIDVGSGLEQLLSDKTAQSIIDHEILPAFRDGDLQAGIIAGHQAIIQALGGEYRERTTLEDFLYLLFLPFFFLSRFFGFGGGVFSGGGGSFGGGGASGSW